MPKTVDSAFELLLTWLRATPAETIAAASHRASIKAKLEQSFGMTSFFRSGSFGNGTNVATYSDVDYFAVIPRSNLPADSGVALYKVAEALRVRFATTSNIRVNSPGVRIPFGLDGAHATEIVPVCETGITRLGFRQFDIPDGNGGWMFSAPDSHNDYVSTINDKFGKKVKSLIRLLKAWKFYRSVPIRSFYLEIFAAKYANTQGAIVYDIDLWNLFSNLLAFELRDLVDPRFPDDGVYLQACSTSTRRLEALQKLESAQKWALDAVFNTHAGSTEVAFDRWDLVFQGNFPTYTGA